MEDKTRSNDDVYDDWKDFIQKRNKFYGVKKTKKD